jgi:hypothetical protein
MTDLDSKPIEGEQAKAPKQDTREMMVAKLRELREQIDPMLEDKDLDLTIVERMNQIFNDVMAALPPDPRPDPVYQRATLSSTMTKLRTQIEAALSNTKPELADKLKAPIKSAEEEAKKKDEKEKVPPPAGPSQSPAELQSQVVQPLDTGSGQQHPTEQPPPNEQPIPQSEHQPQT